MPIVKFDPKLPTLEGGSMHTEPKVTVLDLINQTAKNYAQHGDAELLAILEASGIKRAPQPTATARNTLFLRDAKKTFNHKAYKVILWLVQCHGEEAAKIFMGQFTNLEDIE
jgi:hypothetical protein